MFILTIFKIIRFPHFPLRLPGPSQRVPPRNILRPGGLALPRSQKKEINNKNFKKVLNGSLPLAGTT